MLRRPRRNRKSEVIRGHNRETRLKPDQLVFPLFLIDDTDKQEEIPSLPGIYRYSIDLLIEEISACKRLGIYTFIIFPAVDESLKDSEATYSYNPDNFYLKGIGQIKQTHPDVCLITDVAMDPYNADGHDGVVKNGKILNDETLPILARMAVAQAKAGADVIGPSDMMDGRVEYLRDALDTKGFTDTSIMAYTAKYATAFYGPFRDALDSAPKGGDKRSYQMDPANQTEALLEGDLDFEEGADYLMVKPALHYLDVISRLKDRFPIPIVAYHVSGECAMLKAAGNNGWLDYNKTMAETLLSIKRAGADVIISYLAKDYAQWIQEQSV